MQLDLILAGVPKGEDYLGPKEDRTYYSTFYTGTKTESGRFFVEVRKSEGKPFCYYNYIKYNTIDSESRAGGYFCLSVRMDSYCKDVIGISHFMENLFNKFVVGAFLQYKANAFNYLITSFSERQKVVTEMQSALITLLQTAMTNNDFVPIDVSFNTTKSNIIECNIADCNKDNVLSAVKKYAALAISNMALMAREQSVQKNFDAKLLSATAAKDQEIARISNDLMIAKEQQTKSLSEIAQLKNDVSKLETIITQKDNEIKQYNNRKSIEQIVGQIKEPLTRLASFTGANFPVRQAENTSSHSERHEPNDNSESFFSLFVKMGLPIINFIAILGIAYLIFFPIRGKLDIISANDWKISSIEELSRKIDGKLGAIPSRHEVIELPSSATDSSQLTVKSETRPGEFIDFAGVNAAKGLNIGISYAISAKGLPQGGKWTITGAELKEISNSAVIKPTQTGDVVIQYIVDQIAYQRTVKVQ